MPEAFPGEQLELLRKEREMHQNLSPESELQDLDDLEASQQNANAIEHSEPAAHNEDLNDLHELQENISGHEPFDQSC